MNGFEIREVRVRDKHGVCAVDENYPVNLISAEFFFQLTIPLEVPFSNYRLVRRCPFGKTVFSIGAAKIKFTFGRGEYEGLFEVVANPNLQKVEGFDLVVSPTRVRVSRSGQDQGIRVSPTLFENTLCEMAEKVAWSENAKRSGEPERSPFAPPPKIRKL